MSNNNYNYVNTGIKSCRRTFYAMQSVGICIDGLSPATSAHIWKVTIQPILTYGTQCLFLNKKCIQELRYNSISPVKICHRHK